MEFIRDLLGFLAARKKWWLLPVILALLAIGALIAFTGGPAVAPFIYAVF